MKSVEKVPPGHFKEQFMKDLMNKEVTGLNQMRWRFNGAKNPADFEKNMRKVIDELPLTDKLAKKFLGKDANIDDLQDLVNTKFSDIFKVIVP